MKEYDENYNDLKKAADELLRRWDEEERQPELFESREYQDGNLALAKQISSIIKKMQGKASS